MTEVDWQDMIDGARATDPPIVVEAHTFIKKWPSASQPVLLRCDDSREYVVKGLQAGRMVANDQIVARIGCIADAPVGVPAMVNVSAELIAAEPEMQHMSPGVGHGTEYIPGCSDRQAYEHAAVAANQPRFAALALLFGWMHAGDHQFIYENVSPHIVHSVDHGHFFPNGPNWDAASLANAGAPSVDAGVVAGAALTAEALAAADTLFQAANDAQIAEIIALAPAAWGLGDGESCALAGYLAGRRDILFPAEGG
jgi:hypothetical protein